MAKSAKGKVIGVVVRKHAFLFKLDEGDKPKEDLFMLKRDHPMYDVISAIIVGAAFDTQRVIFVATENEITSTEYGILEQMYLV